DPLLNIELNSSSVWMGNWSQLCPTCKVYCMCILLSI
ncbi:putative palmitoyltransferase TIP1, partial [Trifolium medium]|nr:putative palmitoyltransferase TIP1 [Trifolium medium]